MQHGEAIALARQGEQFATRAEAADRSSTLPIEDVQALKESGYLAMNVPQSMGPDLSLRTCVEAQLELAKGSASTALVSAMQLQVMGGARRRDPGRSRFTSASVEKPSPALCSLTRWPPSLKSAAHHAAVYLPQQPSALRTVSS